MKHIFICGALALGIACSMHIVDAMDDLYTIGATEDLDYTVGATDDLDYTVGAMDDLDGIALYHYDTSVPTDEVFQISWKKADPSLENPLTTEELARFNSNVDLRELKGVESRGSSNSGPSAGFIEFSELEKLSWNTGYKKMMDAGRWVESENKNSIFTSTFANNFSDYFKNRNGKCISDDLYKLLCKHGAGNRINICGIIKEYFDGRSLKLFHDRDPGVPEAEVMVNIENMSARGIFRSMQSGTYNFVDQLTIDSGALKADFIYSQIDEVRLEEIKKTLDDCNLFVQELSNYLFLHKEYAEEIKSEFTFDKNSDLNNVAEYITLTEPGRRWENRQAFRKFLGHKAFFDIDYANRKCTLKGALAGLENFVKLDLESLRLYVDTQGLTNWTQVHAPQAIDAVRDFILCYYQYMYEEFVMDSNLRDKFGFKITYANRNPRSQSSQKQQESSL